MSEHFEPHDREDISDRRSIAARCLRAGLFGVLIGVLLQAAIALVGWQAPGASREPTPSEYEKACPSSDEVLPSTDKPAGSGTKNLPDRG